MFTAEFHTLSEDLLDLLVVVLVPVDPRLGHQHWNIAVGGRWGRVGALVCIRFGMELSGNRLGMGSG